MFMAIQGRQAISVRHLFAALVTAGVILLAARGARAQVPCEDCDQCMTSCVCQADGSCQGVPKPNGTACNDGNDCTTVDTCQSGQCVGGSPKNAGDPCTIPGLGLCATGAQCQVISGFGAFCLPQNVVECADKCQLCDPNSGNCTIPMPCEEDPCSTGQCDSSTGECIPGNEGGSCDDGNVCTSNDRCQSGECVGTAGGTPQPTATPTATPPSASGCVGDCNNDGVVTIDEIITGIDIALGNADVSACENFDANDDGLVTVDELLTAVNNALNGCPEVPATATPRPTNTSLPTSTPAQPATATATTHITGTVPPTQTPAPTTPGGGTPSIGTRAAGTIESTTSAFLVIPDLLSALLGHLPGAGSGSGASPIFSTPFTCNIGGGTVACAQDIVLFPPSVGPPTYTVTLNNCQVTGSTGTLTFNGTLTATGQAGDVCGTIPSTVTVSIPSLTVQTPTGTATFSNFSADVSLSCSAGSCSCYYDTAYLQPTGTIAVAGTNTNSQVTFGDGSSIYISVTSYGTSTKCVPTVYDMEVDGNITLTTNGTTFAATYYGYDIYDDASSGNDMVDIEGSVESACFGDTVDFSTSTDIALGNPCPSAGVVDAYANTSGNTDEITYSSSGVHIDFGAGGSADFTTCLDSQLFACPAG
ncbi:MAG: hypothetical protein ABSA52_14770 [Candidatus Binatia bacterium]|jgi:hypothetical protein